MLLVSGFSRRSPVSPTSPDSGTSITLNGSQDLAVRSRPDLFTQLAPQSNCAGLMTTNPQLSVTAANPIVMPVFPLRPAPSPYSPYSPSRLHIDKRCQHRCSWKLCSIALILLCVALTAMLAYFGAVSPLASHQGELGSIPGRVTPGFLHVGIVLDDTVLVDGFPRGSPFPPPLHSGTGVVTISQGWQATLESPG
ncbi:hypothetical protein PR048_027699 [Dryococelus australis]|uniref:Uncharacterized protein n=1 Tax=Dryococelus australis TaxID=614101 RepID=A0ABQ9GH83_9NEOP|nr:hypothetical protein PR048_027699 [Dryococelus australis]